MKASKCPRCGSNNIRQFIEGYSICADCGLVIDHWNERTRNEDSVKGKRRRKIHQLTHGKFNSEDKGSKNEQTSIGIHKVIGLEGFTDLLQISDSTERNIAYTLTTIIEVMIELGFRYDVLEAAIDIYERLAKTCNFKGKNIKALGAAIVYAAGKKAGGIYGLREIAHAAKLKTNKIFKCYRFISESLSCNPSDPSPYEYVMRICERLALSKSTADIVKKLVSVATEHSNVKGALTSLVAASIYISSIITDENRTQREIAETARVTEATIRSKYKEIIKSLQITISI